METVTRNPSRKSNARKMAAKESKPVAAPQSKPVVDVPNVSQKQITEFIKTNNEKLKAYLTETFEEISEKDVKEISKEVAECVILKRSPKAGGPWGSDTSIIEDTIRAVSGPKVAHLDPEDVVEEDHGEEPDIDIESHHGDAPEEEDNGIEEASETPADNFETEAETQEPPQKTALSEPSKAAKTSKTKSKSSPKKTATQKAASKTKPKAVETKKAAKPKTADKKEKKASTTTSVSDDQIKKLKGKEQWFAATKVLKSQKKIWIQTQDIPDVIGHLYNVSIGKEKLKEDGFEGKGEKVYRKNRILGFKETIEGFLKDLK